MGLAKVAKRTGDCVTYPGEANFIAKTVETTNALLRVADLKELGKPKAMQR